MNFSSFGLKHEIIRAIDQLGFEHATQIQVKAIPRMLTGDTDVIGLAQTGTGKTAAFGLPLIQLVDFKSKNPQGLILCPTRELCLQITGDLKLFARHIPNARIAAVYGGGRYSGPDHPDKKRGSDHRGHARPTVGSDQPKGRQIGKGGLCNPG
jgi:ATP-dependent RNA helicase DeaD